MQTSTEPKRERAIPPSQQRVPLATGEEASARIRRETLRRLEDIGYDSSRIEARLNALEYEWDVERMLEANAAAVSMAGVYLGVKKNPRWFAVPGFVGLFLFQHAVQGWCPPASILRRMGFRTQREIDIERVILKARRGDLDQLVGDVEMAMRALES